MALTTTSARGTDENPSRRPIEFTLLGLGLLIAGGYLAYLGFIAPDTNSNTDSTYIYKVTQNPAPAINYVDNSFYGTKPGIDNTAYVTDLTDSIDITFNYAFQANRPTDLSYSNDVKAVVRATYALKGSSEDISNVWTNHYDLAQTSEQIPATSTVSLNPKISIPLTEYRKEVEQLRTALALPINNEVVITSTVRVTGQVEGGPLNDTRVVAVTVPLDQQIYKPAIKYVKQEEKQITPDTVESSNAMWHTAQKISAVVIALIGIAAIVYGLRKQIFKSAYQRELDRIFRYHDGIIIRARQPAELSNKNVVPVQTFDDILNLEEELNTPIIAAPAGPTATKFIIVHSDIAYVYVLGHEVSLPQQDDVSDLVKEAFAKKASKPKDSTTS